MISLEERVGRLEQLLQNLEHNVFSGLRVSLPAIVTSFDPEKQTGRKIGIPSGKSVLSRCPSYFAANRSCA